MRKFLALTVAVIGGILVLVWALATAMQLVVLVAGAALIASAAIIFLRGSPR